MRKLARLRGTRGQALAEFALVVPLLLLVLFALLDLGRVVYASNALAEAAREGARYGSVQARSANDIAGIQTYTVGQVSGVAGVTATATCVRPGDVVMACAPFDTLQVTTTANLQMITPILGQLMSGMGLNPFPISATAQVTVNN